ncbi:hypothetical protein GALMADRAFT_1047669 [Galerina marginata CBS 339.88]|uniref:Uncharacterized protein n=1 Tax=Galerina marginata (strain CBS 339.88) TaxID=685588 RepID=A0A067SLA7_GALM3|nr:hypothetical protein GALMADRAFT_1047669 [Galerina marginata CBS 339.88]
MQDLGLEIKSLSEGYRSDMIAFVMQLNREFNDTLKTVWNANDRFFARQEELASLSMAVVKAALDNILDRHSNDLHVMLGSLESILTDRLDNLFASQEARYQQLDPIISDAKMWWTGFVRDLYGMKQDVLQLSDQAARTSSILAVTIHDAKGIREIQYEAAHAASDLVTTVASLTETAQTELAAINKTAYLIKQHLQIQSENNQPWKLWLMKILELVYMGDPGSLSSLERLFSYKLALSIFGFGWMAFRTFLTALTVLSSSGPDKTSDR